MTTLPTAADVAGIQKSIVTQGIIFTGEDLEKKSKEAASADATRNAANRGLARTGGRSIVARGSADDIGTQMVAEVKTGVGGGHPDGSARSGRRPRAYRLKPTITT